MIGKYQVGEVKRKAQDAIAVEGSKESGCGVGAQKEDLQ